jgi:NADH-quinone oxidoreductase subunit F
MDIPGYLQLLKENRLADAFEWVVLDNPLPASTGRVCQHPCEKRCRRASVDAPINMREVHRYIFDAMLDKASARDLGQRLRKRKLPATDKRVAVVGAGPAGLSAAFYLALLGHQVTVYEAEAEAGGMLRYALPEYRLPKAILESELQLIRGVGVQFQFNQALGRNLALARLEAEHDAVFLALGTWQELDLRVPGETLKGVHHALGFLKTVALGKDAKIGKRVVVVGGGNAAIDAARTALRLGAEVTIAYRRAKEDMPAIAEETGHALEEGAELICLAAPVQILGDKGKVTGLEVAKTVLGKFDSKGRRIPMVTDEKYTIPCNTIILAIGEKAEAGLMKKLKLELTQSGSIQVDPWTLQTSHPKVYAGGDLVTGAANVTSAMALGKKAASAIDKQLTGEDRLRRLWPKIKYDNSIPPDSQGGPRNTGPVVPSEQRRRGFDEVSHTITEWQARAESLRCLRCDVKASNPASAAEALQPVPGGKA